MTGRKTLLGLPLLLCGVLNAAPCVPYNPALFENRIPADQADWLRLREARCGVLARTSGLHPIRR
jgi:hypothetical protein